MIFTKLTTSEKVRFFFQMLPALWIFSGLFLYDSDKDFATICVIAVLFSLSKTTWDTVKNNVTNNRYTQLVIAAALLAIVTKLTVDMSSSTLRILVAVALYTCFIQKRCIEFVQGNLINLVLLGALSSITYVSIQSLVFDKDRIEWTINAIPYTTFSASISVIALYFFLFKDDKRTKVIGILSYTMAIASILMSGTRGTLLASLVVGAILVTAFLIHHRQYLVRTIVALCFVGSISTFFAYDMVNARLEQTKNEIVAISQGKLNTSFGYRLSMWKAGLEIAKSPTLIGLGTSHLKVKQSLYEQGKVDASAVRFKHYHNEFISTMVTKGILGVISLLSLLGYPLYLYAKSRTQLSGIALSVTAVFSIAALTDVPLSQPHTLAFYLLLTSILMVRPQQPKNDAHHYAH